MHRRCQSLVVEALDDGADARARDGHESPCQRFARNCATRILGQPRAPILGDAVAGLYLMRYGSPRTVSGDDGRSFDAALAAECRRVDRCDVVDCWLQRTGAERRILSLRPGGSARLGGAPQSSADRAEGWVVSGVTSMSR
jgi:hypothetical protein